MPSIFARCSSETSGPSCDSASSPGPEAHAGDRRRALLGELVRARAIDVEAAVAGAALAAVEQGSLQRSLNSRVEIGVREHDDGCLPAKLERDTLQIAGGRADDRPSHLRRAREGDLVDPRMARQSRPRGRPAGHDVHHAVRDAGLRHDLGEAESGERRLLGRLDDARVAARERRSDLPRGDHQREVPRRDQAADADGLALRVVEDPSEGERVRQHLACELRDPAGVVAKVLRSGGHAHVP